MRDLEMKINFKELPFWRNVQVKPDVYSTMPFSLEWTNGGFIKQISVNNNQDSIISQYSDLSYNFITTPPGFSSWGNRLGDAKLQLIQEFVSSLTNLNIMEIGAGSIYNAHKMLDSGAASCTIIDPAIKEVSDDPRVRIIRDYFSKGLCEKDKFDLIVSVNCLEHVEDAPAFLKDIRAILLKSGGKAFLSFPDITEQFLKGDFNAILHKHINYFTRGSVETIMGNCGLKILRSEIANDSINLLLEAEGGSPAAPSCPYMEETYINMPLHFQNSLRRLRDEFSLAMQRGEKIAIHGATNGANNALFLANMEGNPNVFVFDGDELKTGYFLPLCINSIRHTHDREYGGFTKVYVSSLTFFEEIKKALIKEHAFEEYQIIPLFSGEN